MAWVYIIHKKQQQCLYFYFFVQNCLIPPQIQISVWQFNSWAQAPVTNSKNITLELVMKACWVSSLKTYCIKSSLYYVDYYERWTEWVWLPASDTPFILKLNLIFTIKHILKYTGLKTTQLGLVDNPALGKYWTEHTLGYFDPAGWVKHFYPPCWVV